VKRKGEKEKKIKSKRRRKSSSAPEPEGTEALGRAALGEGNAPAVPRSLLNAFRSESVQAVAIVP
jgi:hypothetical protein